jgi:hypothetical protein
MPADDRSAQPRHLRAVESARQKNPVTDDEFIRQQTDLFGSLVELTGGWEELWSLDAAPLPDEAFDWSAVEPVDRPFVSEVLRLVEECCHALLDTEHRTIARRLLARVAANDPRPLRRSPHAARCAAGLMWLVGTTSGPFRRRGHASAGWIWAWFGVSNCADRGRTLYRAGDFAFDCDPRAHLRDPLAFDAAFLHSQRRAVLISTRDHWREVALSRRTISIESREGRPPHLSVRTRPTRALTVMKGLSTEQRAIIAVGLGDQIDDAEYLSFTIPDAHDLVHMLQRALDDPIPYLGASPA